jgi:DNA-directed RNA polymerase specialized sigma24 family protein
LQVTFWVTLLQFVPSMLSLFLEEKAILECPTLRWVLCAGEALPLEADRAESDRVLAVHAALTGLEAESPRKAQLVKLRFFVGMTLEEAAEVLGISARTADNYWAHARAWLFREISEAAA